METLENKKLSYCRDSARCLNGHSRYALKVILVVPIDAACMTSY